MRYTRQQAEDHEHSRLAPYAQRVGESAGRAHPEPPHSWRTAYQRDRARIVHSRAFRRLEYKTQVFLNGAGDHLRTRLTHTMEVASVARTAASALGLNQDLTEVIALAHDLGHSPVGHAGEEMLNELMRGHGGFEHNLQSLRVVEKVEMRYPDFSGLNLSWEVLEGLRKHDRGVTRPATDRTPEETFPQPSLEAQIANLADEMAYYCHDLEDGIDHGLITEEQLREIDLWQHCAALVQSRTPHLTGDLRLRHTVNTLLSHEVEQLVAETDARLTTAGVNSADAVRRHPDRLAAYPPELARMNRQLRKFLYQNLYFHPEVASLNQRGVDALESVFVHYLAHPEELGESAAARVASEGLHRTVCDYVSGFTDRYLLEEAGRIRAL